MFLNNLYNIIEYKILKIINKLNENKRFLIYFIDKKYFCDKLK